MEYSLTSFGRSLTPVIEAMAAWGSAFNDHKIEASDNV
jgi:DNA-binding HxlR family transcriptional regulator